MIDTYLIPQGTVITGKGDTAAIELGQASVTTFLVTLEITDIVEQESLEISFYGSNDSATWSEKPIASFPQRFYPGQTPLLLDLSSQLETRFIRAHWETNRWGRGSMETMFKASLRVREVPAEMLAEARAEANARR